MTQVQNLKESHDQKMVQVPSQKLGPEQNKPQTAKAIVFSRPNLDLSKIRKVIPKAVTDRESYSGSTKVAQSSNLAGHLGFGQELLSPLKSTRPPTASEDLISPTRLNKKVKLKPLVPKFNAENPSPVKDSLQSNLPKNDNRAITSSYKNKKPEKTLENYDDYFISEIKNGPQMQVKTEPNVETNYPSSARLPSINRQINTYESPKQVESASKGLLSDRSSNANQVRISSLSPRQPSVKISGKTESLSIGNLKLLTSSSTPQAPVKKNQIIEKKPVMHFGAVKSTRTFYFDSQNADKGRKTSSNAHSPKKPTTANPTNLPENDKRPTNNITVTQEVPHQINHEVKQESQQKINSLTNEIESIMKDNHEMSKESSFTLSQIDSLSHVKNNYPEEDSGETKMNNIRLTKPNDLSIERASVEQVGTHENGMDRISPILKVEEIPELTLQVPKKSVTFTDVGLEASIPVNIESRLGSISVKPSLKKVPFEIKVTKTSEPEPQKEEIGSSSPPIEHNKHKIFKDSNVNFFEFNEHNKLFEYGNYPNVNDIIRSARRTKTISDIEGDTAPILVSYAGEKGTLTIQPKFMENYGTMCFTELWSSRYKHKYKIIKKEDNAFSKVVHSKAEDALYRPNKNRKKSELEARIRANKKDDINLKETHSSRKASVYQ